MAYGKAIIATSVGAIPEMLSDNCGLIVKPKDTSGLIKGLELLCNNTNLRMQLGQNAQVCAKEKFSIDAVFKQYMSLWN
jgi:glycosyltransferase involved in cell wall biosynthesis